jgi:hypothetical protein
MTLVEEIEETFKDGYQDNTDFKRTLVSLHGRSFGLKPDGKPKICGTCPNRFQDAFFELKVYVKNMAKIAKSFPATAQWKIKDEYKGKTIAVPGLGFSLQEENLTDQVVEFALKRAPGLEMYFEKATKKD